MSDSVNYGIISLIPIFLTLFLAFKTKDAVFALIIDCVTGVDPATGLSKLFQNALGNDDRNSYRDYDSFLFSCGCHQCFC